MSFIVSYKRLPILGSHLLLWRQSSNEVSMASFLFYYSIIFLLPSLEKFISKKISFNCLESSLALQKCVQIEVCTHKKAGERHLNSKRLSKSASFETMLGDARILMETKKWLQKFCHNIYLYIQSYYRVSKECNLTI